MRPQRIIQTVEVNRQQDTPQSKCPRMNCGRSVDSRHFVSDSVPAHFCSAEPTVCPSRRLPTTLGPSQHHHELDRSSLFSRRSAESQNSFGHATILCHKLCGDNPHAEISFWFSRTALVTSEVGSVKHDWAEFVLPNPDLVCFPCTFLQHPRRRLVNHTDGEHLC